MRKRLQGFELLGIICLACLTAAGQTAQSDNAIARETEAYIREADVFNQRHDFKSAIPLYRKALELQKKRTTLDKAHWRQLVDNLGQAYGISGDLKNSKAIYTYGLKQDPKYWLFNYNMACTYAEMDDVDHAIFHLRAAFANREKGIKYPSPWTDPSFQKLMNNDKFVDALREIDIH